MGILHIFVGNKDINKNVMATINEDGTISIVLNNNNKEEKINLAKYSKLKYNTNLKNETDFLLIGFDWGEKKEAIPYYNNKSHMINIKSDLVIFAIGSNVDYDVNINILPIK